MAAFLAFQMATAAPYRMNWKTGTDQLMIVSVGTGGAARARPDLQAEDLWLLDHAKNIPGALMNAASAGWDMACRVVGDCRFGGALDREIGDLVAAPGETPSSTVHKQFAYVRYDPDVSRAGLDALGLAEVNAEAVQVMDSIEHIDAIRRVGTAYAAQAVHGEHLRGFA